MALVTRVKSPDWVAGDILTAADLKAELNNLINALTGTYDVTVKNLISTGDTTLGDTGADVVTINGAVTANAVAIATANIANGVGVFSSLRIATVDVSKALVPIGSIIPFYDFSGALTFDTTYWKYCDGSSATVGGSTRTLPDLSGRYLVGFGGETDGAGDIDTATWNTTVVGSALHQVDLRHRHAVGRVSSVSGASARFFIDTYGSSPYVTLTNVTIIYGTSGGMASTTCVATGSTPQGADYYSDYASSATQTIQPRSIRVRFIMRAA